MYLDGNGYLAWGLVVSCRALGPWDPHSDQSLCRNFMHDQRPFVRASNALIHAHQSEAAAKPLADAYAPLRSQSPASGFKNHDIDGLRGYAAEPFSSA